MADKIHCIRKTLRLMPQEAEMLAKLEKSREQRMFRDADLVVSDMRSKYGL